MRVMVEDMSSYFVIQLILIIYKRKKILIFKQYDLQMF